MPDAVFTKDIDAAARVLWQFHRVDDAPEVCDAIIGLGSYDLRVAERCAQLFADGYAKQVLFTGAVGNWTKALYEDSEAEAFRSCACSAGVPDACITIEPFARNLGENIRLSAAQLPKARQVMVVTKPQTQLRSKVTIAKQWPGIVARVLAPLTQFEDQPLPHHDRRALICEMVGDTLRLALYPQLGFQAEIDVPVEVTQACQLLIDAGFTDHMPG